MMILWWRMDTRRTKEFVRREVTYYFQVSMARCVCAMLCCWIRVNQLVFFRAGYGNSIVFIALVRRFHDTKRVRRLCDTSLLVITMDCCNSMMKLSLSWLAHD